jgi:hypothetical protein
MRPCHAKCDPHQWHEAALVPFGQNTGAPLKQTSALLFVRTPAANNIMAGCILPRTESNARQG